VEEALNGGGSSRAYVREEGETEEVAEDGAEKVHEGGQPVIVRGARATQHEVDLVRRGDKSSRVESSRVESSIK
jgi:hypothetical protein